MKKKLFATLLALTMALSLGTIAFAADGDEATAPKGTEAGDGVVASTGLAVITSDDGVTTQTENDDDNLAKANDDGGADISVWAKAIDSTTPTYKVDIAWGAMKFEYKDTSRVWNPQTHAYETAEAGSAGWTTEGYVDAVNNEITITNHSNAGVDASFVYANVTNIFNDTAGANNVVGNFFATNENAIAAAAIVENTETSVTNTLADNKISLATAVGTELAAAPSNTVYFAFSGKPDEGKGAVLDDFTKVGIITVTIAPVVA
ncbi:MAG: hypothetical protein PHE47_08690 [Oscillospiraceae bacterium]|nr:hypothetical protein [Oscillospiraceae bacterium]